MREKVAALALALLLALTLSGCGEDKSNTNRPDSDTNGTTDSGSAGGNTGGDTPDDGVTDSNDTARSRTGRYRDDGSDRAFNDNHGSTFGGAGEELQKDAEQFPPTVYDSMTGAHGAATWQQMLDNGFVHDTDGFLLDGENACWS